MQIGNVLTWQRRTGEAIAVRGFRIYPESLALAIRLPFAGYVWNYPVSVLVERDGRTKRLPIVDATRVARWALSLGLIGLTMALSRQWRCEGE